MRPDNMPRPFAPEYSEPEPVLPQGWIEMETAFDFLRSHIMAGNQQGVDFVLQNWHCKYINLRVDMRTGACILSPGNAHTPSEKP